MAGDGVNTSPVLEREQLARASETGLHLVEHEQRSHLGATLAQRFQPFRVGQPYAGIALHRFHHYASCTLINVRQVGHGLLHLANGAERDVVAVRQQRQVAVALLRIVRQAQRAVRAAVVALPATDDARAPG